MMREKKIYKSLSRGEGEGPRGQRLNETTTWVRSFRGIWKLCERKKR
jgi:hypothetical protein